MKCSGLRFKWAQSLVVLLAAGALLYGLRNWQPFSTNGRGVSNTLQESKRLGVLVCALPLEPEYVWGTHHIKPVSAWIEQQYFTTNWLDEVTPAGSYQVVMLLDAPSNDYNAIENGWRIGDPPKGCENDLCVGYGPQLHGQLENTGPRKYSVVEYQQFSYAVPRTPLGEWLMPGCALPSSSEH